MKKRTCAFHYLIHKWPTVAIINEKGEYEIKPSKHCAKGDEVWVLEGEGFTRTKII